MKARIKNEVDQAYQRWLRRGHYRHRQGQVEMIDAIAHTLGDLQMDGDPTHPCLVVESPTGTGKTAAYLLALLPIARHTKKKLILVTPTSALQEQLASIMPDFIRHAQLSFSYTLLKGHNHYLCQMRLEDGLRGLSQHSLIENDDGAFYRQFEKTIAHGKWDGERATFPNNIDDQHWDSVSIDFHSCTKKDCRHYQKCFFYRARRKAMEVDCVIVNYDIVLADIVRGGGAILPPLADSIYVFDEAHRFNEIACRSFARNIQVRSNCDWLGQNQKKLESTLKKLPRTDKLYQLWTEFTALLKSVRHQQKKVIAILKSLPHAPSAPQEVSPQLFHTTPVALRHHCQEIMGLETQCLAQSKDILSYLQHKITKGTHSDDEQALYILISTINARVEKSHQLWQHYVDDEPDLQEDIPAQNPPLVKWCEWIGEDCKLAVSPILAAEQLNQFLWPHCAGVVLTSATLSTIHGFELLQQEIGLPAHTTYLSVMSDFVQENAVFQVPPLACNPNQFDEHTQAIVRFIAQSVQYGEGMLVLFASRKQMSATFDQLPPTVKKIAICQGNVSKIKMVERHSARIQRKLPSIIFGLASFAEGIDLPGNLCTHIVIAKLPFANPTDPLEQAYTEWLNAQGISSFDAIQVPKAALRLKQACGRLLRTADDSGMISLLDIRIKTQSYGRQILSVLPQYSMKI